MPVIGRTYPAVAALVALAALMAPAAPLAGGGADDALDTRVKAFLDSRRGQWHDMNVPEVDGQTLHDLVVKQRYTRALEIGTSTGHSSIWIAWALSKTGGRLITIDIDERRHREALANFDAAGVSRYIDARLADAHALVPALPGPFDFVFADADKDWNVRYMEALLPKLAVGGCYTTHNIRPGRQGTDYLLFAERQPNLETTVDTRGAGLAISFKRRP